MAAGDNGFDTLWEELVRLCNDQFSRTRSRAC